MKRLFFYYVVTVFFLLYPPIDLYAQQEPPLYQIYNAMYGTNLGSDQELDYSYGLSCSDDIWFGSSGYVVASARYAGQTQKFGYYTDVCEGDDRTQLFNITRDGYLTQCSWSSQNRGDVCVDDNDCIGGYCFAYYTSYFLIGAEPTFMGFYDDPSDSPRWFSQPSLNGSNANDHMKTYLAADFNPSAPEYLIAWEDQDLGDGDYNDLVLVVQNVVPSCLDIECCTVNADCDDGDNCTVDTCADGYCQHTPIVCNDSNICTTDSCNPASGCVYTNNTAPCSDGDACTVSDTCGGGTCQPGTPLVCNDANICTTDSCNPAIGCVYTNNSSPCDDGNPGTVNDICVNGSCVGTPLSTTTTSESTTTSAVSTTTTTTVEGQCSGEIYLGGAEGVCLCQQDEVVDDPPFNRPGRRGLSLTCDDIVDFCACYDCDPETVDTVWTIACTKPGLATIEETGFCSARVTVTTGLCEFEAEMAECIVTVTDPVNNWSDSVCLQIGEISVDLSEETVAPDTDSIGVDMGVINRNNTVRAMIMTIADEGNNLICNECFADPDRALGFTCTASEQADGTCRVILYSTVDYIREGEGVVARVIYDVVDPDYCAGEDNCVDLNITDIEAADQFNEELCICADSGRVCFDVCGDIYPRDCPDGSCACGDGVVDLFDILEMVDIILGEDMGCGEPYTGTACQMDNGDVPNGMPPYCGTAPYFNDCKGDGEVNILDLLVIIDMSLGRTNCCGYCLYGQIY